MSKNVEEIKGIFARKDTLIKQDSNKAIDAENNKKINKTYSLPQSTLDQLKEIKYKTDIHYNDILVVAINEYYNKTINK